MMPNNKKFTLTMMTILVLIASGCLTKKSNTKKSSSSNTFVNGTGTTTYPTPTPNPTDPAQDPPPPGEHADLNGTTSVSADCTIIKPGGLSVYCHQIPTAVSKGCGNIGNGNTCPTPTSWNSYTWPGNGNLNTDAELNIRVIPRAAPSQGTATTNGGGNCGYQGMPYTLLSMTVDIKTSNTAPVYASFTFDKIPNNKPSYPYRFPVPPGLTGPVVVQVRDLKWDCPQAGNCGTDPTRPMQAVWHTECVSFDLQFSTDGTRSWNRPIIN